MRTVSEEGADAPWEACIARRRWLKIPQHLCISNRVIGGRVL